MTAPTQRRQIMLYCLLCLLSTVQSGAENAESPAQPTISSNYLTVGEHDLHYAAAGNQEKPGLLFIHGTPGSWSAFRGYLSDPALQENYFMVSVDRLGWGESGVPKSSKSTSVEFSTQANAIAHVLDQYPEKKWVVIGHSLGASIAPKVGLAAPEQVVGLLLLAGSLKPKLGKPRWYNRFASTLLLKWMLPSHLNYSNDEIMVLRRELTLMESQILSSTIDIDLVIIQGMKDKLVSPKNARYVAETWRESFASVATIELPDAGHFIPWEQFGLVVQTIFNFQH